MEDEFFDGNFEWENEEDIYNKEFRQMLLDDDEISLEEDGFMRGYDEED